MRKLLLLSVMLLSGCASAGLNSDCAHVNGKGAYGPVSQANADVYLCHMGCFGMSCPKPDYQAIDQLTSDYLKSVQTEGKITTTGPGIITFTPSK